MTAASVRAYVDGTVTDIDVSKDCLGDDIRYGEVIVRLPAGDDDISVGYDGQVCRMVANGSRIAVAHVLEIAGYRVYERRGR